MKKSPKQKEIDNLLHTKKNADQKWEKYIESLQNGEKIDCQIAGQLIRECNAADYGLLVRNLRDKL